MRQIRCLSYGFVDYSGKRTKSFDILTSDQELEVRTATYGPEIDQSQCAKSVGHVLMCCILFLLLLYCHISSMNHQYDSVSFATIGLVKRDVK